MEEESMKIVVLALLGIAGLAVLMFLLFRKITPGLQLAILNLG